jgi:YhcH/YjgK/YiaL family protein
MIFDTLENVSRYTGLGYNLPAALNYLVETDLAGLPIGRTDLDGENLYVLVQEYDTKLPDAGKWEAHRKYIDVQFLMRGVERMGFANLCTMQLAEYIPEKDFQTLSGSGNFVDVFAGSFVIFFPEDAHMPGLCVEQPEPIRKVVLKVRCTT